MSNEIDDIVSEEEVAAAAAEFVAAPVKKNLTLVLWGPTNVGKSSLFNKLTHTRKAIVANKPGVTVDTHSLIIERDELPCNLRIVDSGGVGEGLKTHALKNEIEARAQASLNLADIVFYVADGTAYSDELKDLALRLRKDVGKLSTAAGKKIPVWLILNKCDRNDFNVDPFHALGFDKIFSVSAEHGLGIGELLEEMGFWAEEASARLGSDLGFAKGERKNEREIPRVLILGRPNVGKSTFMNHISNKEISAVSAVPGTTRDYLSEKVSIDDFEFMITDTAGIRRAGRRDRDVEWVATEKIKDLFRIADVAVLMCDADEGITDQDATVAGTALDAGLSLIVALNKWDLVKENDDVEYKISQIDREKDLKLSFLQWCPLVRVSAKTGLGVKTLKEHILKVFEARKKRVQTSTLNNLFDSKIKNANALATHSNLKNEKLYYMSQVDSNPPAFVLFCNSKPENIHFSFRRYVTNSLRDEFGFSGTPIKLHFRQRGA